VLPIDAATFESLVAEALDGVPPELTTLMQNVVVLITEEPPAGEERDLLGLYEGIPLTERDGYYSGVLPDRITIFRGPTLRYARDWDEAVREVRITVVHEIAHHFGIDDDRLHTLGYG
jgi:predicted Zn-dependent protease with MMP-like domain